MRAVVCAAVTLAAAFALWGHAAVRGAAQGQQQGDKPVEQTRKNIQVLKGLPESQLFPEMNFISAALGVQCGFCHVSQGKDAQGRTNWVWESDEKEEKKTARDMMRMVLAVNGGNFGLSRGQVTCYTCHRGQQHPQNMPTLPLAQSGHEPGPSGPADASRQSPTPTAEEVLAKYVAAVGGREAINGMRSVVMRGTREASQGRVWPVEVTLAGADRYAVVASIPAQGQQPAFEIRQAYSGGKGWIKTPRGVREFTPAELSDIRGGIALVSPLKIAQPFPRMTFGGVRQVGDRDAYVLVERREPDTTVRYFFDRETGLLVRELRLRETVLNALPEQVDYEDYRDVGGVKLPFKITISAIDTYDSSTRKFTDIRTNVPVDDAIFQMPAAPPKP